MDAETLLNELRKREPGQRFYCTNPDSPLPCSMAGLTLDKWCEGCVVCALRAARPAAPESCGSCDHWGEASEFKVFRQTRFCHKFGGVRDIGDWCRNGYREREAPDGR